MKLILIRCGDVELGDLPDFGHGDPPLSALGHGQAQAVAAELLASRERGQLIEAVYSSPMRSAQSTAEEIAVRLALPPVRLHEALVTLTPESLPDDGAIEAMTALQERAWSAVEALKELHPPEANLVLVSHDLPIRAVVCRALAMPLTDARRFLLAPGSLSAIKFRGARTILAKLNETCYLG